MNTRQIDLEADRERELSAAVRTAWQIMQTEYEAAGIQPPKGETASRVILSRLGYVENAANLWLIGRVVIELEADPPTDRAE